MSPFVALLSILGAEIHENKSLYPITNTGAGRMRNFLVVLAVICLGCSGEQQIYKSAAPHSADSVQFDLSKSSQIKSFVNVIGMQLKFIGREKHLPPAPLVYMSINEVTNAQYLAFMDDAHYEGGVTCGEEKNERDSFRHIVNQRSAHPDCPAEMVSWYDAVTFCQWLGKKEHCNYRLPSAREWEILCLLGGGKALTDDGDLARYAWFLGNSDLQAHPVGTRQANELGIYDMLGNVAEWVQDSPSAKLLEVEQIKDHNREQWALVKGGYYSNGRNGCACDRVVFENKKTRSAGVGFRVVCEHVYFENTSEISSNPVDRP